MKKNNLFFMREALKEAKKAFLKNEIPVGCVIVSENKIVSRAHNNVYKNRLFFGHAEFLALKKLNQKNKYYRFYDVSIYTTLEPCLMCLGALIQTRIKKLYYGASNFKSGFTKSFFLTSEKKQFNEISVISGLLSQESELILKDFFSFLRKKNFKKTL